MWSIANSYLWFILKNDISRTLHFYFAQFETIHVHNFFWKKPFLLNLLNAIGEWFMYFARMFLWLCLLWSKCEWRMTYKKLKIFDIRVQNSFFLSFFKTKSNRNITKRFSCFVVVKSLSILKKNFHKGIMFPLSKYGDMTSDQDSTWALIYPGDKFPEGAVRALNRGLDCHGEANAVDSYVALWLVRYLAFRSNSTYRIFSIGAPTVTYFFQQKLNPRHFEYYQNYSNWRPISGSKLAIDFCATKTMYV